MDDQELENPFEADGPSKYDRHLYSVQIGHGSILVAMHKRLNLLEEVLANMQRVQSEANKVALMPSVAKDEREN